MNQESYDTSDLEKKLEQSAEELKYFLEAHVLQHEFTHDIGLTNIDEETLQTLIKQLDLFLDSTKTLEEKIESLQQITKNVLQAEDKRKKINKIFVSRESYTYTFFEDLDTFELTSCFAFECAKRKNLFLAIQEENYKREKIDYLVKSQNVMCIKNYINESDKFNKIKILQANIDFLTSLFSNKKFLNQYITKKFTIEKGLHRENVHGLGFSINQKNKQVEIDNIYSLTDYHLLIKPLYTKPTLGYEKRWEVDVRINLAQDEQELLEYIKHLKKYLYTNAIEENGVLKDFELASQNIKITKRDLRMKLADSLFIYDALQANMTQKMIIKELDGYKKLQASLSALEKFVVKNSSLYFDILNGLCQGKDISLKAFVNSSENALEDIDNRYEVLIKNIACFFCMFECSYQNIKDKYNIEFSQKDKQVLEKYCENSGTYMKEGMYSHFTYRSYKKFIIKMIDDFQYLQLYSHNKIDSFM